MNNTFIDEEYKKLSIEFQKRFNRRPYIAVPSGSKEKTIEAIKICLEKNEDILDKLLYPDNLEEKGTLY